MGQVLFNNASYGVDDYKLLKAFRGIQEYREESPVASCATEAATGAVFSAGMTTLGAGWKAMKADKGTKWSTFKNYKPEAAGGNIKTALKAAGGIKTQGVFAVFQAAMEAPDVIDAYKIDTKTGNTQLLKSGVKIAAGAGGFWAGSVAGGLLGAKAGAAIGTLCCPVVGTLVGSLIGGACGMIGGWLANKGAGLLWDKCTSKGEYEKTEAAIHAENKTKIDAGHITKETLMAEAQNMINEKGEFTGTQEQLEALEMLMAKYEQPQQQRKPNLFERIS